MKTFTLRHADGNYTIVSPPSVLDANLQLHAKLVRAHHVEMSEAMQGQLIWTPDDVAESLYKRFALYYQKLGALLNPPIDTDTLDPISRHLFFVCTEPVERSKDVWVPGISGLEQLMGYSFADGDSSAKPPKHTTGDSELDVLVHSLLIFKGRGLKLAQMLGVVDLQAVCRQGNELMKVAEDGDTEEQDGTPQQETWTDDPMFLELHDRIQAQLEESLIWVPAGF